jgi:hypothetical protein
MTKQELLQKVQQGDYLTVGKALGISGDYAKKLIDRKTAKFHPLALKTLQEVVEARETLIKKTRIILKDV